MSRQFGLSRTGSAIAGGNQSPSPPRAPVTQRYSKSVSLAAHYPPARQDLAIGDRLFIPGRLLFKRGQIAQALFDVTAEIAGVSQPTVSRWEEAGIKASEPNRDQMERIRSAAMERGLPWSDGWFFQSFPDEPVDRESAA